MSKISVLLGFDQMNFTKLSFKCSLVASELMNYKGLEECHYHDYK